MEKITSFTVNHLILPAGIYISRTDGDIVTYDIRFRRPNKEEPMDIAAMHTIEHLIATFVRNSPLSDRVIYFGPMGCRTGFYLLMRSTPHADTIKLIQDALRFTADFEGEIPGASAAECGNYADHNLSDAKKDAAKMSEIVTDWDVDKLLYPN